MRSEVGHAMLGNMIESNISNSGILTIKPAAPLETADFQQVAAMVDGWLTGGKLLQGILIDAPSFPGWKDFEAFGAHMRFVRDHHREIRRVAIVTDTAAMGLVPLLARHFVAAELRHFPANEREAAVAWLNEPVAVKPRHLAYSWFASQKVLMMSVDGKITSDEYKEFLNWFRGIIAAQSPVSCVINLDNFGGAEFGAAMADLRFGLAHASDFRRIAMVGDQKWIKRIVALPNPFPIEIRAFEDGQEELAWNWASS